VLFPRLRPRFERRVSLTPEEVAARVAAALKKSRSSCRGFATAQQIELLVPADEARFWSPQLLVNLEPADQGCVLTGHFQPNGNVWTMFMAGYGFVGLCGVTGLLLGFSQWVAGEAPWGLLALPGAGVLIAAIYVAAGVGQRLGADQSDILEQSLNLALETPTGNSELS